MGFDGRTLACGRVSLLLIFVATVAVLCFTTPRSLEVASKPVSGVRAGVLVTKGGRVLKYSNRTAFDYNMFKGERRSPQSRATDSHSKQDLIRMENQWYKQRNTPSASISDLAAELLQNMKNSKESEDPTLLDDNNSSAREGPRQSQQQKTHSGKPKSPGQKDPEPLRSFSLLSSNPSQALAGALERSGRSSAAFDHHELGAAPSSDGPDGLRLQPPLALRGSVSSTLPPGDGYCTAKEQSHFFQPACNSTSQSSCLNDLSESLPPLEKNVGLYRALHTLRATSCFRHGQSISVLGYHGTGSNLLFEIVRFWTLLASDRGLVASTSCSQKAVAEGRGGGKGVRAASTCTFLCRDVAVKGATQFADIVLMSHAHPRDSLRSRCRSGHFCDQAPPTLNMSRTAWRTRCLSSPRIMKQEGVSQCHRLMSDQADLYGRRLRAGLDVQLDVHFDDYRIDPHRTVRSIGAALGICPTVLESRELLVFVVDHTVRRYDQERVQPEDQAVDSQTGKTLPLQPQADCKRFVHNFASDDTLCKVWTEGKGGPLANAILGADARHYS